MKRFVKLECQLQIRFILMLYAPEYMQHRESKEEDLKIN